MYINEKQGKRITRKMSKHNFISKMQNVSNAALIIPYVHCKKKKVITRKTTNGTLKQAVLVLR